MRRFATGVGVAAVFLFWATVLAAIPFWHKAADHFHYALPGRVPKRVHYHGREYIQPGDCVSPEKLARRFGTPGARELPQRRIGTVWGWLTRPRGMYTFADLPSTVEIPTIIFVSGGWGDCRVPYDLSGGP